MTFGGYFLSETGIFDFLSDRKPPFRLLLEREKTGFLKGEFTGTVSFTYAKKDSYTVLLDDENEKGKIYVKFTSDPPLPGDRISFTGTAYLFTEARNPGESDMRRYYDCLGCYYAVTAERYTKIGSVPRLFRRAISIFRMKLERNIKRDAEDEDVGFFLSALSGNQSELPEEMKDGFRELGIQYLLSVSGAQLTLFGMAFYGIIRRFTHSLKIPALLTLFLMAGYTCFVGFSVSAIRAFLVLSLRILAPVFKRRFDYLSALSFSYLLIFFGNPAVIYLSFSHYLVMGGLLIGTIYPAVSRYLFSYRKHENRILFLLIIQAGMSILSIYYQYQCSVYTGFLTVMISPFRLLRFLSVFLGSLAGFVSPSFSLFFYGTAHYLYKICRVLILFFQSLPFGNIITGKPETWRILLQLLLLSVPAVSYRFLFRKRKKIPEEKEKKIRKGDYYLAIGIYLLIYVFGIFFLRAPKMPENDAELIMLDVGQGDSILIRESGKNYLLDCGSSDSDAVYQYTLSKALAYYGITVPDMIFVTHGDGDHTSGLLDLLKDRGDRETELILPGNKKTPEEFQAFYECAGKGQCRIRKISEGDRIRTKNSVFLCLSPPESSVVTGNDISMVLRYEKGNFSMIFTGDISAETESKIIAEKVNVLKVAHHGSRFSSSEDFLRRLRPEAAFISCGSGNPYGHPAKETLDRLLTAGAKVYCTKDCGAIRVRISGGKWSVDTYIKD